MSPKRSLDEFFAPEPPASLSISAQSSDATLTTAASSTLTALSVLSTDDARTTWERLRDGYTDKSGAGYAAAIRMPNGCLVCQKAPNRAANGYIQIAPVVTTPITRARKGQARKMKPLPQNGHRLAVIAWHPEDSVRHLLDDGWHASHRCGEPRCIDPDHLVVEPKDANEARKACRDFLTEIMTVIDGKTYRLKPVRPCPCDPQCISHTEVREAERVEEYA